MLTALILVSAIALIALLAVAVAYGLCRRLLITGERLQSHIEEQLRERIQRTRELERMLDETRAQATPAITHPALRDDEPRVQMRRKYSDALERELAAIDSPEDREEYIATIEARLAHDPNLDQDELAAELFA